MPPLNCKGINNKMIIAALKDLNIEAEISGRNDITVDKLKVPLKIYLKLFNNNNNK